MRPFAAILKAEVPPQPSRLCRNHRELADAGAVVMTAGAAMAMTGVAAPLAVPTALVGLSAFVLGAKGASRSCPPARP